MDVPFRTHRVVCSLLLTLLVSSALPPLRALADTEVPLVNGGMESPYAAVTSGAATITGQIANGWADNSFWQSTPAPTIAYSEDRVNPHGGASSQKIAVSSVGASRFQMIQQFAQRAGNIYTLSAWVRGTPGVQVALSTQQASSPYATYIQSSIALTNDWQPITATGYITTTENVLLMLSMSTPGTVWVDDFAVSYTPGSSAPTPNLGPIAPTFFGMHVANYQQSALRNSGLEPPYAQAGVANGISGQIAVHWSDNSSWASPKVTYSQDTVNPHGGTSSQRIYVQSPGTAQGAAVQFVQPVTVIPERSYTFSAWLRGDPGLKVDVILRQSGPSYTYYAQTTAVLTANWKQFAVSGVVHDTGEVYLMFHASSAGTFWVDDVAFTDATGNPVSGGVPWPQSAFGQLRLWDSETAWTALEPAKGVWDWETLDMWVAAAEAHGVKEVLLTLGQSPGWASSQPDNVNYIGAGAPAPPNNIQDWRDYITAVGQRYKGSIRNYEIWNEPNDPTYYAGTVAQLLQLTQEAYKILKSIDPANIVVGPVPYAVGYLDQLLQGGIASYIDVIPFHIYTYALPPETIAPTIANVRLIMAKNGVSNMPFWDTEGASGDTTVSEEQGAAYLVRRYLVELAYGAVRYDWYTWSKGSTFCAATEENDPRQLTKAGVAFGILRRWLSGASLTGVSVDAAGTWQIGLTLAGGTPASIVWNPTSSVQFPIPASVQAVAALDIFNGSTAIHGPAVAINAFPLLLSSFNGSAPSAPTGLIAAAGDGQVTLTWTASPGATSYNVYAGDTAGGEGTTPIATDITNVAYTNTGLVNGTPYYYKVEAVNVGGTSALSNEVSTTPQAGTLPPPPHIASVENAEGGNPAIAPNTWIEIDGGNLASPGDARAWKESDFVNGQMPTQLDGVSVKVNGKPAYVYYISPGQLNVLTPPDALDGPVPVQVTNDGGTASILVQAQPYSPSFFVIDGGPYVLGTHVDGSLLGSSVLYPGATPARPGETIVLYANGFGPTLPPVVGGAGVQWGTLPVLPSVKIGGTTAVVMFAGVVSPGLYQFNIVVPPSAADGDNTLIATYGGFSTQSGALLAVQD